MKISIDWLKEYIDLDESVEVISSTLTDTGLEVEGTDLYEEIQGGLEGLVIGEVITCESHPNADKLRVTTVDIGLDQPLPIVCGAPNIAKGQKVVLATVGTTLYPLDGASFKIKKSKIRGEISLGMVCAEDEIGLGKGHDEIIVLDTSLSNGTSAKEYFNLANDTIIEIGLTPNRADGCSHFGTARDLKAAFHRSIKFPDLNAFREASEASTIKVSIENQEACPRYSGLEMTGLTVAPSPKWMQNRLKSIGLTPINNIVDVTNYVLHSIGQPLHAFDLDKIQEKKITVKTLVAGTKFTTLDQKEYTLHQNDLMVCDGQQGICIAGVHGGNISSVTGNTTSIFLESAYFSSAWVRNTATRHKITTDASFRYERGTNPRMTIAALKWAAILIQKMAGGRVSSSIVDLYPAEIQDTKIKVKWNNINRLIGKQIASERIIEILTDLDIQITPSTNEGFVAVVPPYRVDVTREADIVEEILRIYGYNNIALDEAFGTSYIASFPTQDSHKIQAKTIQFLAALGCNEMVNNSLTNPQYVSNTEYWDANKNIEILNPLSEDLSIMRRTMVFSGLEVIKHNVNRKQINLRLFEFGQIYNKIEDNYCEYKQLAVFFTGSQLDESWLTDKKAVDFYQLSSLVHQLLNKFSIDVFVARPTLKAIFAYGIDISVNDQVLVSFGKLASNVQKISEVSQEVFYAVFDWATMLSQYGKKIVFKPISKYPEVRRDLSLVINEHISFEQILLLARQSAKNLVKKINVFSVYHGDRIGQGKKSYALSFILQDEKKTLNDKTINKVMTGLINIFEKKLDAIIRK